MQEQIIFGLLKKITDIIHDREKSLKQQTEEIYNSFKKYSGKFHNGELGEIESKIIRVYQCKEGVNLISEENPFYDMCKVIAKADYEEFINERVENIFKDPIKEKIQKIKIDVDARAVKQAAKEAAEEAGKDLNKILNNAAEELKKEVAGKKPIKGIEIPAEIYDKMEADGFIDFLGFIGEEKPVRKAHNFTKRPLKKENIEASENSAKNFFTNIFKQKNQG